LFDFIFEFFLLAGAAHREPTGEDGSHGQSDTGHYANDNRYPKKLPRNSTAAARPATSTKRIAANKTIMMVAWSLPMMKSGNAAERKWQRR
jgi:hypothetical protein